MWEPLAVRLGCDTACDADAAAGGNFVNGGEPPPPDGSPLNPDFPHGNAFFFCCWDNKLVLTGKQHLPYVLNADVVSEFLSVFDFPPSLLSHCCTRHVPRIVHCATHR